MKLYISRDYIHACGNVVSAVSRTGNIHSSHAFAVIRCYLSRTVDEVTISAGQDSRGNFGIVLFDTDKKLFKSNYDNYFHHYIIIITNYLIIIVIFNDINIIIINYACEIYILQTSLI